MKLFSKYVDGYVDFGSVFVASGTRNTHGQGWPHHRIYKYIPGFTFKGTTHITKTFTAMERMDPKNGEGNLELDRKTLLPIHLFPDCVQVDFLREEVCNAVGLSGLAFEEIFDRRYLQKLTKPFIISFMAIGKTLEERLFEYRRFMFRLLGDMWPFKAPFAIEINVSCPNTCHDPSQLVKEVIQYLEILKDLKVPLGIKLNVLASHEIIVAILASGLCDFIDIPNTLPLTAENIVGSKKAAFIFNKYGSGGLSCPSQFPNAALWVKKAREMEIKEKIILGSIYNENHVRAAFHVGADAISVGAVSIVRPHRLEGIIKEAQIVFNE